MPLDFDTDDLERLLGELEERARQDPELREEWMRSWRGFVASGRAREGVAVANDAAHAEVPAESAAPEAAARHREYFLLERQCERFGVAPALVLLAEEGGVLAEVLLGSQTTLLEVLTSDASAGHEVEDLLSGRRATLRDPELDGGVQVGDLIVGRAYPLGPQSLAVSAAAVRFRQPGLANAIRRDLAGVAARRAAAGAPARAPGAGAPAGIHRLSQLELETLFFTVDPEAHAPGEPLELLEARLVDFLLDAGFEVEDLAGLQELADSADQPGAFLGPLLENLAFHGSCDLEEARRVALDYFLARRSRPEDATAREASSSSAPARRASAGRDDAARAEALDAFERGRDEGRGLDELFAELEQALGLEEDEDGEDLGSEEFELDEPRSSRREAAEAEGEFEWEPVGIAPIVEEYAWDRERSAAPLAAEERRWVQDFAEALDRGPEAPASVDALEPSMLRGFCWTELPRQILARERERSGGPSGAELAEHVRSRWDAIERFAAWLDEEHCTRLGDELAALRAGIEADQIRLLAICREAPSDPELPALWVRVLRLEETGVLELEPLPTPGRSASGLGSRRVDLPAGKSWDLREGDLLRAVLEVGPEKVRLAHVAEAFGAPAMPWLSERGRGEAR